MRPRSFVALACLALGLAPAGSDAGYSQIVVFGDSLSDAGNVSLATGGATPPAPYYMGHYSNGPVWVEDLAVKLGVPVPTPSLAGGTDYAFGGAETGVSGLSSQGTPNVGTQITTYLSAHPGFNANQLITVWGGANDFLQGVTSNPAVVLNNLGTEITAMAAAGGKSFVVPNLPELGDTPFGLTQTPAVQAALNALTLAYNAQLGTTLSRLQASLGINIVSPDVDGILQAARRNPGSFGFNNVTQDALDVNGGTNATGFLFWDPIHPTAAGHSFIANAAFLQVTSSPVPEPSSAVLLAVAGVALGLPKAVGPRRHRRAG